MTMTRYAVFAALHLLAYIACGQGVEPSDDRMVDLRSLSFHAGLGFPQLASLGTQYQIDARFAVGIHMGVALIGAHIDGGFGGGINGSYFFDRTGEGIFLSMNVVKFEASYLATSNRAGGGATLFEAAFGHDSTRWQRMGFFWQMGIAHGQANGLRPLISPAAKIGLRVNL